MKRGTLAVAAAGNRKPGFYTMGTSGTATGAATVAAASVSIPSCIERSLNAGFSSPGPALQSRFKLDVAAPGSTGGPRPPD